MLIFNQLCLIKSPSLGWNLPPPPGFLITTSTSASTLRLWASQRQEPGFLYLQHLHNVCHVVGLLNEWTLNVCPNPHIQSSGSLQVCLGFYFLLVQKLKISEIFLVDKLGSSPLSLILIPYPQFLTCIQPCSTGIICQSFKPLLAVWFPRSPLSHVWLKSCLPQPVLQA